jgi:hypothetical protein
MELAASAVLTLIVLSLVAVIAGFESRDGYLPR